MNGYSFSFCGADLVALPQRALWWPDQSLLCVSDLHLGKSERAARRGGPSLPPYETTDTLARLETLLMESEAQTVICLGDSFDDPAAAAALPDKEKARIEQMMQGRNWIWIEGNHDPLPTGFSRDHLAEITLGGLSFCHIARPGAVGEISGHYHPKAGLRGIQRPAFLVDQNRLILPAFGTYTGGLRSSGPVLSALMHPKALAILTGAQALPMPMPR